MLVQKITAGYTLLKLIKLSIYMDRNGADNELEGVNKEKSLTAYMTFSKSTVHLVNIYGI